MARPKTINIDFAAFAKKYQVTERTCRNWHAAGADLADPESVGTVILKQRVKSTAALEAVGYQLKQELETL